MTDREPRPRSYDAPTLAYSWDFATDRLEWEPGVKDVLLVEAAEVATGAAFEARIGSEQRATRHAAMTADLHAADPASGAPYRARIGFSPAPGREPIWLDDCGRCWHAADGRPIRAEGVLRRTDEQYLSEERLLRTRPDEISPDGLNRHRMMEGLGAALRRAERTHGLCALFMVSVHGIEAVNTHLGFNVGDELIAEVGHVLNAGVAETASVYRYASNILAIIDDSPAAEALAPAAAALLARMRDTTIRTSAGPMRAAIAIGAVALPLHAKTVGEGVAYALDALEEAKQGSDGGVVVHQPEMVATRARRREHALSDSVVAALEDDRLLLALQPIVQADSGETAYYEGLLRLRRRDGTLVSAAAFVGDAEKLGLARLIDVRALELGLALLARHPGLTLSLNVSGLTAGDADWIAVLVRATDGTPSLARRLIVEITETALIRDLDRVAAFVELLRGKGCRVAIDDFGSGYTSFRFLKSLKVDILKIDGMFVDDLPNDAQGRIIVKTMIDMATALGLETVAEWVSDEAARDVLRAAGATHLQGFLYGQPILAEELEQQGLL